MGRLLPPRTIRHIMYLITLFTLSACGDEQQLHASTIDVPVKTNRAGAPIQVPQLFSSSAIQDNSFLDAKDAVRKRIMSRSEFRSDEDSGFPGNEDPALLVDNPENLVTNLSRMEELQLRQAELTNRPWSDYYWPTYRGMLGNRYADRGYPEAESWLTYYRFIQDSPATAIVRNNRPEEIDNLSPSEKYDLIVGDENFTLTQSMWNAGKIFWDEYKRVETWFGLCHGWAAASYMAPRPAQSIRVYSPITKTAILLRPSDIKGMLALLWANGHNPTRFLGGRCDEKNPRRDDNGRIIASDCFDMNPGAWHVAIVNQLGVQKRSLILDAAYDYEVWNQPVYRYKYRYFNPNAGIFDRDDGDELEKATVKIEDFTRDRFKKYRDERTKYVVGVSMEVSYASEVSPSMSDTNGPRQDSDATVRYTYDLELDENKNIIGGEWYEGRHPDFLWTPVPGSVALSSFDEGLQGQWDGTGEIPAAWLEPAKKAAGESQPLARLVNELVKRAQ